MNLVCLSHPQYDGQSAPNLGCKICCTIFVETLKIESLAKKSQGIASHSPTTSRPPESLAFDPRGI